jgi:hypothetical protein
MAEIVKKDKVNVKGKVVAPMSRGSSYLLNQSKTGRSRAAKFAYPVHMMSGSQLEHSTPYRHLINKNIKFRFLLAMHPINEIIVKGFVNG